ncbi:uncharacterized protein [Typha angustifolia]|uniref:uncharacterized protein n=1 Tax=Typha angustifolia TaxID=59011 RepID=UPI003C2CF5F7
MAMATWGTEYMTQWEQQMERRQLFLRSYQFSRKLTAGERVRRSLVRVRRLVWIRMRKLPRLVWSRLSSSLWARGRRRSFHRHVVLRPRRRSSPVPCFW